MEAFLGEFAGQLENFQGSFKLKSLSSNHLLWAEAEETRLLETLNHIKKQNQSIQSQIDHIMHPVSKNSSSHNSHSLKSEIHSLSQTISSLSKELSLIDTELKKKDDLISSLSSKLEILNPPDLGTIGLPSEWKYLEGKQIEYEIISPRFLNDSDDSLKGSNEVRVFSPSNKAKRNNCKSMDIQANFCFDAEDFKKVYEKSNKIKESERIDWNSSKEEKEVVVEEFRVVDEEGFEDEKIVKDESNFIEYTEEDQSGKIKVEEFEVVETFSGWSASIEVPKFEEEGFKQRHIPEHIKTPKKIDENKEEVWKESSRVAENPKINEEVSKPEIWKGTSRISDKNLKIIEETIEPETRNETSTVPEELKLKESLNIKDAITESKLADETIEKPTELNYGAEPEELKTEVNSHDPSDQLHSQIQHLDKISSPELVNTDKAESVPSHTEINLKSSQPEAPQPPKKFFTKYQPKVIPKKLQAKKGQNDDFFNELL